MKHSTRLIILVSLAAPLPASAGELEAGLAAVRRLGTLNGQALACAEKDAAAHAKVLMLAHAPKTQRFGAAYEEATQESYLAQTKSAGSCPDAKILADKIDEVAQRLKTTLPVATTGGK